jgi:hypothetical protein
MCTPNLPIVALAERQLNGLRYRGIDHESARLDVYHSPNWTSTIRPTAAFA